MKEGLSHNHRRRTGVQKNQRNTSCKTERIEKGWQRKQVKSDRALTDDEVDILYDKNLLGLSGVLIKHFMVEQHPALWPERMPRA